MDDLATSKAPDEIIKRAELDLNIHDLFSMRKTELRLRKPLTVQMSSMVWLLSLLG